MYVNCNWVFENNSLKMISKCIKFMYPLTNKSIVPNIRQVTKLANVTTIPQKDDSKFTVHQNKTEHGLVYLDDPDNFGTLSGNIKNSVKIRKDEGDIAEETYLRDRPLSHHKLTTKQYADLIKQYVEHKRIKEAINVLEVRMLTEDRVKPENYIYNILIGACADVGYTKKAFQLYNDMKKRALKVTGDTYTCLFNACSKSPWTSDGLKRAKHLRQLMIEKRIEPNLTNYNAMIKAFGHCGDISTAFQIVDEMMTKKIKIRVHTFNFLLQACISDKHAGLRHALIIWRKMLKMKEKPNIFTFNLMLKCVKECDLGAENDIEQLLSDIKENILIGTQGLLTDGQQTQIIALPENIIDKNKKYVKAVQKFNDILQTEATTAPNFLSKDLNMQNVMSFQKAQTLQDKFAIVGKEIFFLKEMLTYTVMPDIKTFTQMLFLIDDTSEAETRLMNIMKIFDVKTDIDFYNLLIKRRCMRFDYENALEVKKIIQKVSEFRKAAFKFNKKLRMKPNIITYGVLAMACVKKENAEELLTEMKEHGLKVNIEIMGTLLKQATFHSDFSYIAFVLNMVRDEKLRINDVFIKHLVTYNEKCETILGKQNEEGKRKCSKEFVKNHGFYIKSYIKWLKDVNAEDAFEREHPWKQFDEVQPEPVQRLNLITEPKPFIKRKMKFVQPYRPSV